MLSEDIGKINVSSNPSILIQQFMKKYLTQDYITELLNEFESKNKKSDENTQGWTFYITCLFIQIIHNVKKLFIFISKNNI